MIFNSLQKKRGKLLTLGLKVKLMVRLSHMYVSELDSRRLVELPESVLTRKGGEVWKQTQRLTMEETGEYVGISLITLVLNDLAK